MSLMGLSPYTRGNRDWQPVEAHSLGSIPVHTGKPPTRRWRYDGSKVYPRTHGETVVRRGCQGRHWGLSPYTRGNHNRRQRNRTVAGSIPVHTGKPTDDDGDTDTIEVYPRTHGETCALGFGPETLRGLSPYTRGNRTSIIHIETSRGSIPVHTGKPLHLREISLSIRVYPRTHGETFAKRTALHSSRGLSPYTRGNRGKVVSGCQVVRSIPVHTGKPITQ